MNTLSRAEFIGGSIATLLTFGCRIKPMAYSTQIRLETGDIYTLNFQNDTNNGFLAVDLPAGIFNSLEGFDVPAQKMGSNSFVNQSIYRDEHRSLITEQDYLAVETNFFRSGAEKNDLEAFTSFSYNPTERLRIKTSWRMTDQGIHVYQYDVDDSVIRL